MKRFAQVLIERLQWTRLGFWSLWRRPRLSSARPGRDGPAPFAVRDRRRETADTWTLTLEPVSGDAPSVAPGPVRDGLRRSASARCRSRSAAPRRAAARRAHRARGRRRDRGDLRERARARCSACAGRSERLADRRTRRAATWSSSPAGSASRRCGRSSCARSSARRSTARSRCSTAPGRPPTSLYPGAARASGGDRRRRRDGRRGRRRWGGQGRRRAEAGRGARFRAASAHAFVCGPEVMMRFTVAGAPRARRGAGADSRLARAQHACGVGHCGHCQLGPTLICRDGPGLPLRDARAVARGARAVSAKPKLAMWKFASCDGCQLSLLDCEDELLAFAGEVEIA